MQGGIRVTRTNPREKWEGQDVHDYIAAVLLDDTIVADELTAGRIKAIYVRLAYGEASVRAIAKEFELPEEFVRKLKNREVCKELTQDL
jgi:hypothetical protein